MAVHEVIDEYGEIVPLPWFLAGQRREVTGASLETAICQLGLAAIGHRQRGLHIYVCPARLMPATLVRLAYLVRDCAVKPLILSTLAEDCFTHRITRSVEMAINLLASAVDSNRRNDPQAVRLTIGRGNLPSPLQRCVDAWTAASDQANIIPLTEVMQRSTDDRFVAFERIEGSPGFVLRDFGRNNPRHALRWYEGNIGNPLPSAKLDLAYHWFCNTAYRDALALRQPLCERVEAQLQLPDASRLRRRYNRIILPFYARGRQLVLVATQPLQAETA